MTDPLPEFATIPEFAALCRERCGQPAQGFDDGNVLCGMDVNEDGEVSYVFCGRHWGVVL